MQQCQATPSLNARQGPPAGGAGWAISPVCPSHPHQDAAGPDALAGQFLPCAGGTHQCGSKAPHRPGIRLLPGQARTWAAPPEAEATPGEGQGWGGGPTSCPHTVAPVCLHRSLISPHPPSRLSLPWVTQLQLIPLARPGLYLGHGAVQRRRRRAGSRGGGWGVPEAALQEGDGGQGTEDGNRGQAPAHPTPCRSACQVPRSRRSTLT